MNTPHWRTNQETQNPFLGALFALPLLAIGCGDNGGEEVATDTVGPTGLPTTGTDPGGTTGSGPGTGGATGGATGGTTGDPTGDPTGGATSGDTGPPPPGPAARGIRVTDIMINQGIQTELVLDGTFVGPGGRTAVVIGGRGGVIQAFWELAPDFSARDIEGRLTIYDASGALLAEYVDTKTISGPSGGLGSLDGGFSWILDGEEFPGDGGFSVEFFEVGGDGVGDDLGYRFPAEGSQPIEPDGSDLVWDVVVITTADCSSTMELTDDRKGHFTQLIYNNFPVSDVNLDSTLAV